MQPPDQPVPGEPNSGTPSIPPVPPTPPSAPQVPPPVVPSTPVPPPQPPAAEMPSPYSAGGVPPPQPPPGVVPEPPPYPESGAAATGDAPRFNLGFLPNLPFVPAPTKDEKMWAMFLHLGGAVGGLAIQMAVGIPGGSLLIPLIIWLIHKDNSRFLNDQGREVLNFQLCLFAACLVLLFTCIGAILIIPLMVAAMVLGIVGAVKANDGVAYRYPATYRVIK